MNFVWAAFLSDLSSGEAKQVEVDGNLIALVRQGDEVFAVSDICTHELAYLSEGFVEGESIECPLHGSQFELRTGKVLSLPATKDLPTYPVKIEGDDVLVGISEE